MFVMPQFKVGFSVDEHVYNWIIDGEENLDVFCKILRRNGCYSYSIQPAGPSERSAIATHEIKYSSTFSQ